MIKYRHFNSVLHITLIINMLIDIVKIWDVYEISSNWVVKKKM